MKLRVFEADGPQTIDDTIKMIRQRAAYEKFDREGFYICNVSDIVDKYRVWKELFPRVKPFYGRNLRQLIFIFQ